MNETMEKYNNNPTFFAIVNTLVSFLETSLITPSEVKLITPSELKKGAELACEIYREKQILMNEPPY